MRIIYFISIWWRKPVLLWKSFIPIPWQYEKSKRGILNICIIHKVGCKPCIGQISYIMTILPPHWHISYIRNNKLMFNYFYATDNITLIWIYSVSFWNCQNIFVLYIYLNTTSCPQNGHSFSQSLIKPVS